MIAGTGAMLLRFGTGIDRAVSERVLAALAALDRAAPSRPAGVFEVLPSYASLFVHFDPLRTTAADVERWLRTSAGGAECADLAGRPRQARTAAFGVWGGMKMRDWSQSKPVGRHVR